MWEEFKKFIMRGNVVDLAVGVCLYKPRRLLLRQLDPKGYRVKIVMSKTMKAVEGGP